MSPNRPPDPAAAAIVAAATTLAGFEPVRCDDPDPPGLVRPPAGARLPRFVGLRKDYSRVTPPLDGLTVAVVGAGSVGRRMCIELARTGVAALYVVDPGRFKPESLLTQPIGPEDVGRPKASDTARLCSRLSPFTRTFAFDGPVQQLPPHALAAADVVLLATDNLAAEVETGQRCLSLGKPLVQAAVHGETCVAQVRVFVDGCPACQYGPDEWAHYARSTMFTCAGFAAGLAGGRRADGPPEPAGPVPRVTSRPTHSVSPLCSLAADLALMQVLRFSPGIGEPPADCLVEYCGYTNRITTSPLAVNPDCPCDHARWVVRPPPSARLADCTLRDLAAAAGADAGDAAVAFTVDDYWYVEAAACPCETAGANGAGGTRPVGRFLPLGGPAGDCDRCGRPLVAQRSFSHRPAPAGVVGPQARRPLREMAAAPPRWVLVRSAEAVCLFADGLTEKEAL